MPRIGQMLIPYRLVGEIVWFSSSGEGRLGVGQVRATCVVGGHYDEDPMGRAEAMEIIDISNTADVLPVVFWRPMWANWITGTPYPTWVVRWLCC